METLAIVGAVNAAASMASGVASALQQSGQASAESKAADYNAAVLKQQGIAETGSAAANMGMAERRSAAALGDQAASFGQAGIGTGGSVLDVERQSARNARMDSLNIWYGGELAKHQAFDAAQAERYQSDVYSSNAKTQLYGGIGTSLLTSAARGYGLASGSAGGII